MRGDVANATVVILNPDGEIVWRGGSYDIKKTIAAHVNAGLLAGLDVPVTGAPVAQAIKSGSLAAAQVLLSRLKSKGTEEFRKILEGRFEELRKQKRALFDLLQTDTAAAWTAWKAGESYLRCFPKADDAADVRKKVDALKNTPAVKDNLAAKRAFAQLASMTCGSKSKAAPQAKEAFMKLAEKYPDTEYGKHAAELGQ